MDTAQSDRPSLPPIKMMEPDKYRREEQEYSRPKDVKTPLPAIYHSGPPPPYSAAPPNTSTTSTPQARHIEYLTQPQTGRDLNAEPNKALLPSLHEALGVDRRQAPYTQEPPTTTVPHPRAHPSATRSPPPPPALHRRDITPPQRPQSFAPLHVPYPHLDNPAPRRPSETSEQRRHDWPDHHSVTSASSYRQRTPPSAASQHPRSAVFAVPDTTRSYEASPQRSTSRPAHFSYGYTAPASTYPAPSSSAAPQFSHPESSNTWRSTNAPSATPTGPQAYGESVKRHLDLFDFELALNDIAEHSTVALDFSRQYGARLHQSQRSGIAPGVLPAITEVDGLINKTQRTVDLLAKMRETLVAQQALYHQQAQQEQHSRVEDLKRSDSIHQQDDSKAGGFAGAEPKKRRGRNAAPGRCHSCNRAETPEWRRGPDGARTLCNACGLHYAKLTRKAGANKAVAAAAAAAGGSSLRPKNEDGSDA